MIADLCFPLGTARCCWILIICPTTSKIWRATATLKNRQNMVPSSHFSFECYEIEKTVVGNPSRQKGIIQPYIMVIGSNSSKVTCGSRSLLL